MRLLACEFCDAALAREERLGVGAGVRGHEIVLSPDVVALTEPT